MTQVNQQLLQSWATPKGFFVGKDVRKNGDAKVFFLRKNKEITGDTGCAYFCVSGLEEKLLPLKVFKDRFENVLKKIAANNKTTKELST